MLLRLSDDILCDLHDAYDAFELVTVCQQVAYPPLGEFSGCCCRLKWSTTTIWSYLPFADMAVTQVAALVHKRWL
jgi:hypothetical protein